MISLSMDGMTGSLPAEKTGSAGLERSIPISGNIVMNLMSSGLDNILGSKKLSD